MISYRVRNRTFGHSENQKFASRKYLCMLVFLGLVTSHHHSGIFHFYIIYFSAWLDLFLAINEWRCFMIGWRVLFEIKQELNTTVMLPAVAVASPALSILINVFDQDS